MLIRASVNKIGGRPRSMPIINSSSRCEGPARSPAKHPTQPGHSGDSPRRMEGLGESYRGTLSRTIIADSASAASGIISSALGRIIKTAGTQSGGSRRAHCGAMGNSGSGLTAHRGMPYPGRGSRCLKGLSGPGTSPDSPRVGLEPLLSPPSGPVNYRPTTPENCLPWGKRLSSTT
jgi:hypothetical protein